MRVRDIMSHSVETITPAESAVFANELMWRKQIHHLVVMQDQALVGVLSDTDLGGGETATIADNLRVEDVMTRDVVRAEPDMRVDRAINIFRERKISCLPVLEDGKLLGIVTTTDIQRLASRGVDQSAPYPPLNHLRENLREK